MAQVVPINTDDAQLIGFAMNRARLMESGAIPFKAAVEISIGRVAFKEIGAEVRAYVKDLIVPAKTQEPKGCSWKKEQPFDVPVLPDISTVEETINSVTLVAINLNPLTGLYWKLRPVGFSSNGYRTRTSSYVENCAATIAVTSDASYHEDTTFAITDRDGGFYSITGNLRQTNDTTYTVKQRLRTADGSDLFREYALPSGSFIRNNQYYSENFAGDPDSARNATGSDITTAEYATIVATFVDGEENFYVVMDRTRSELVTMSSRVDWIDGPSTNTNVSSTARVMYVNGEERSGYTDEFFSTLPLFFPFIETEEESIDGMLVPAQLVEGATDKLCMKDGLFFTVSGQVRFVPSDSPTTVFDVMGLPETNPDIEPSKRYTPYIFFSDGKKAAFLDANYQITQLVPSKIIAGSFSPKWIDYVVKLEDHA